MMASWRLALTVGAVSLGLCPWQAGASGVETPLVILRADNSYDVARDGTYVQTYRFEFRPTTAAAARAEAQQAISYSPSLEDLTITEAYTEKPDGRRIPVLPQAVHDQLPRGSQDLSSFSDQRQKVLVFPEVSGGDVLVYAWKRTVHMPVFAGQFMTNVYMSRNNPWGEMTLTIRAPASLPLHTETHDMAASVETEGADLVYRWQATNPASRAPDTAATGPYDRLPRVFVSSFPGYQAFATAYAGLANPKAEVTPTVQALSDRLTVGITDRREQARALYDWVSLNIRYVAVYLNMGALEPHPADTVIADGYGDCKDHVVLFDALLAARGIKAEFAMINLGNHYTLSAPPTFAQLNHAISYLPEFGLYADTTAGTAPFGTLPFEEYGKPVVHAVTDGIALRHVPMLALGQATMQLHTEAVMSDTGAISGRTTTVAEGPFAVDLRRTAAWAEATGIASAASAQLRALGTEGTGTFSLQPPGELAASYAMSGSFNLDAQPDIADGDSFMPPLGLRMLVRPGDLLLGPPWTRKLSDTEPSPCYAGRQVEDLSLQLPIGRHLARLPKGLSIANALLDYTSTWQMDGQMLDVHRELLSHPSAALCRGNERRMAADALRAIRHDERRQVALADE